MKIKEIKGQIDTETLVINVFKLRNEGRSLQEIGDKFGYTREYIRQLLNGNTASVRTVIKKHGLTLNPSNVRLGHFAFNKKQIIDIIQSIKLGANSNELANKYKVSNASISGLFKSSSLEPLFKELNVDAKEMGKKLRRNFKQFSPQDIQRIFELYKTKKQSEIAEIFRTSQGVISAILLGKNYKEIVDEMGLIKRDKRRKFSEEDIIQMFQLRNSGYTLQYIADEFGTSPGNIRFILIGRIYADVSQKYNLRSLEKAI